MFATTDIVNGLTTEIAGAIILAALAVVWKLRTPEARQNLRTEIVRRLTALLNEARATLFRWEALPFAVSLIIAIALEGTSMAVASQSVFATVLLGYACIGLYFIVRGGIERVERIVSQFR